MSKTRAIRFSGQDERQIEEFLEMNPVFDFSSMARIAILEFIKNPKLALRPITVKNRSFAQDEKRERAQ